MDGYPVPAGFATAADGQHGFGVDVGGVPVGDATFVAAFMEAEVQKVVSKITTVTDKLRDLHLQSLYAAIVYSLTPMFTYWTQHAFPDDVRPHARRVDAALAEAVSACVGPEVLEDDVALARLRLPARMYGGAVRSLEDMAPAAFLGALCRAVPAFLDHRDEEFNVAAGFLPMLEAALTPGAFDAGTRTRFAGLLRSGTCTGAALMRHWAELQAEVGEPDAAPLNVPAAAAGTGIAKVQRAITKQREQQRFNALDAAIRQLPRDDMRRAAWINADRNSTAWVTAWPSGDGYFSNPEFLEITTRYFGLPSPACAPLVGQRIADTRVTLDRYGARLAAATLPGDGWRIQHDALKWRIFEDAKEMGARCRVEVFGLFAACLPQAGRAQAGDMPARKRQGMVPDFLFTLPFDGPERDLLFELKTRFTTARAPTPTPKTAAAQWREGP